MRTLTLAEKDEIRNEIYRLADSLKDMPEDLSSDLQWVMDQSQVDNILSSLVQTMAKAAADFMHQRSEWNDPYYLMYLVTALFDEEEMNETNEVLNSIIAGMEENNVEEDAGELWGVKEDEYSYLAKLKRFLDENATLSDEEYERMQKKSRIRLVMTGWIIACKIRMDELREEESLENE